MTYVLDASAALEIAFSFNSPNGEKAKKYKELLENADSVIAPDLYKSEITNCVWKYLKAGYIDEENAKITVLMLFNLVDSYTEAIENSMEVLHEAARLNISTYDMFYFVLARHNAATLLTCDQKLKNLAIDNGISVE